MDNDLQSQLLDNFLEASGKQMDSLQTIQDIGEELTGAFAGSRDEAAQPRWATQAGASTSPGAPAEITQPRLDTQAATSAGSVYPQSATPSGSSVHSAPAPEPSGGVGSAIESVAATFLESGFGVAPLVGSLLGLFGGSSTPPPLETYPMPPHLAFESADTGNALSAADFDQMGAPRPYSAPSTTDPAATQPTSGEPNSASSGAGSAAGGQQITVNVQTMDARSFLDNSDQIAQAVRGAMLNLGSINDVVNEL